MIKKYLYMALGFVCLGMAYVGVVVPGIPFSIFLVIAAWAFAKSSKRMHDWLYNHKYFGPFLTNWTQKKVFPTKGKYAMIAVMASRYYSFGSLLTILPLLHGPVVQWHLVAIWAWRYPGSVEEQEAQSKSRRKDSLAKINTIRGSYSFP